MEISQIIPHVESLIFAADRPLPLLEVLDLLNNALAFLEDRATLEQVETALEAIKEKYSTEFYAFEVRESGGGYQFLTKKEYYQTVAQLNGEKFLKRLSTAALETLAIVAYKQPISKGEIEHIRGVSTDYSIQKLLEKELIVISGRSEQLPGKPLLYSTSKAFMDYFGLNSPKDLPKLKEVFEDEGVQPTFIGMGPGELPDEEDLKMVVSENGELVATELPGTDEPVSKLNGHSVQQEEIPVIDTEDIPVIDQEDASLSDDTTAQADTDATTAATTEDETETATDVDADADLDTEDIAGNDLSAKGAIPTTTEDIPVVDEAGEDIAENETTAHNPIEDNTLDSDSETADASEEDLISSPEALTEAEGPRDEEEEEEDDDEDDDDDDDDDEEEEEDEKDEEDDEDDDDDEEDGENEGKDGDEIDGEEDHDDDDDGEEDEDDEDDDADDLDEDDEDSDEDDEDSDEDEDGEEDEAEDEEDEDEEDFDDEDEDSEEGEDDDEDEEDEDDDENEDDDNDKRK